MAIYRLYTYDPPGSPSYKDPSQGGFLYNTGRFDSSAALGQGCSNPDSQGFNDFPSLLAYANQRGETLRGPVTRDFVNALCGGSITVDGSPVGATAGPGSPTPSGGGTGGTGVGCSGASCGPSGPVATVSPGPPPVPSGGGSGGTVAGGAPTVSASGSYSGTPSPYGGSLSGGLGGQGGQGGQGGAGGVATTTTGTTAASAGTGFDLTTFLKSPFGILILVLLVVILLTRGGA